MKKKLISILLAGTLLASVLAGCGSGSGSGSVSSGNDTSQTADTQQTTDESDKAPAQDAGSTGNVIEIRASWWGDTTRNEKYNEIIDRFEAENPDIKVVRESGSWNDYWDKLATQVAGGNAPDFISMHVQYVADYAGRGVLADLQPYIDSGILDTGKMEEGILDGCKYDGTMCLIPMGVTFTNMIVNQTLLEKYGVEVPTYTTDYSWDDLMKMGEQLKAAADAAGETAYIVSDMSPTFTMFRYMARQSGGDLYTSEGKLGFEQSVAEEWLAYWAEMRDKGLIPDAASSTEDAAAALEQKLFTQGAIGYACTPANQLYQFQEQMPDFQLTLARNPIGNSGGRGEYAEGAHFSINSSSSDEKKEAAAKLMNFWVNSESAMEIFQTDQGVPANSDMADYVKGLVDENQAKVIDYVVATMPVAYEASYAPVGATEVQAAFEDAANAVQFGQMTPQEGAKQFYEQAKSILGE
ncbi:sugar ABC transporter substrate-binding protein [bacterium 1xD8-48]|nr:sugar ABC transporter substrate-binding protein [bacterium 1xD8-48]